MSKSDLSVKIHPEIVSDELRALGKDFRSYKQSGDSFRMFGRDVPFTEEPSLHQSNVWKVHVLEVEEYEYHKSQYDNTTDRFHLVYCQHPDYLNNYCLIHVLSPDAHQKARKREFVAVAERRAEEFIASTNRAMKKSA